MTAAPQLDLAAVKARQQATWVSGDFAEIATLGRGRERAATERLGLDLRAGDAEGSPFPTARSMPHSRSSARCSLATTSARQRRSSA